MTLQFGLGRQYFPAGLTLELFPFHPGAFFVDTVPGCPVLSEALGSGKLQTAVLTLEWFLRGMPGPHVVSQGDGVHKASLATDLTLVLSPRFGTANLLVIFLLAHDKMPERLFH